ncbi:hypothetical protein ACFWIB_04385 [Streptomyces sp. NPDC127051]|uniref:hypothetical protein n=1 Tax=Streptomyces sp. NPDC127051 TaxID=3347119 RepID=UPI00365DBA54
MITAFFAVSAAAGFVGLCLAGPARARDLYAAPALGTCALIVLLAALGAALLH